MQKPCQDNSIAKPSNEEEETLLREFRQLVEHEKGLNIPKDDVYLLRFLRYKKNDMNKAFQALTDWWIERHKYSDLHDGIRPSRYAHLYPNNFSTTFKYRDREGRQILLWKPSNWDPRKTHFIEQFLSTFCIIDTITTRQLTQVNGVVVLYDLSGLSLQHVRACTPGNLRTLLLLVDGFPARIKAIHFINYPPIFHMVFSIAQKLMKEKMRKRIRFHGWNHESLHEFLEPEILPKKYGGKLDDNGFEEESFIELLHSREQYFIDLFENYSYHREMK